MTDLIRVDAHVHLYRSIEEGYAEKTGYEVWEYGEQAEVHITDVFRHDIKLFGAIHAHGDVGLALAQITQTV